MTALRRHPFTVILLFVGLSVAAYLGWLLRVEMIILFASGLFALSLYRLARWLSERTGLSHRLAVGVWYIGGIVLTAILFTFTAQRISDDYGELSERIPAALDRVENRLQGKPVIGSLGGQLADVRASMMEDGTNGSDESDEEQRDAALGQLRILRVTFRTLAFLAVWAALSFYIAVDGQRYLQGALSLIPADRRKVGEELADCLATALPWWLVGRLASMTAIALLTAPGLFLLGIPLPFTLALIAGAFSFVPMLGPAAATIPALLVTLDAAPDRMVWVLLLYGGVQFLESYFITPHIQKHVAAVPPLLLISAQVLLGVLVGIAGVMFSTPLILALMVTIQVVYVRHGLHNDISTPGPSLGGA